MLLSEICVIHAINVVKATLKINKTEKENNSLNGIKVLILSSKSVSETKTQHIPAVNPTIKDQNALSKFSSIMDIIIFAFDMPRIFSTKNI